MQYIYYQDPGHGWVQVPYAELVRLQVAHLISEYSYHSGQNVYLEEDADVMVWIEAKKARNEDFSFQEIHQDPTPIRNYRSYTAPPAPAGVTTRPRWTKA